MSIQGRGQSLVLLIGCVCVVICISSALKRGDQNGMPSNKGCDRKVWLLCRLLVCMTYAHLVWDQKTSPCCRAASVGSAVLSLIAAGPDGQGCKLAAVPKLFGQPVSVLITVLTSAFSCFCFVFQDVCKNSTPYWGVNDTPYSRWFFSIRK